MSHGPESIALLYRIGQQPHMILLLDNYDSFVYNLDRFLRRLGQKTLVIRSDAIGVDAIARLDCSAIVLSPGPKAPDEAGCSLEVVRRLHHQLPILGVCLGHQAIGQAFGARIIRGNDPVHGKTSTISIQSPNRLFDGLPSQFEVARYHSLTIEPNSLPPELRVVAWSPDQAIMAIEHVGFPVFGVQFHPESILTEHGYGILANFLKSAKLPCHDPLPASDWLRS